MRVARLTLASMFLILAAACGGSSQSGDGEELTLVAYSTPREVYERLIEDFRATPAGEGVRFAESYGSSGEQSRAVESGLDADVLAFSLEPDMTRLVDEGIVDGAWVRGPHRGMVTESVVVFAVRKGNPLGIETWDDLVGEGVEVITPNPFTSGGARWNVMAAYGAQLEQGRSHEQAVAYVRELFEHVTVQDKSARESLQTFAGGKGDVLLAYENEALLAQAKGEDLDYVVPEQTILIENPVAVTKTAPAAAQAFLDFVRSPQAQRVFGEAGYRPVNDQVAKDFDFPVPAGLFTIAELGGWGTVQDRFFDRDEGIVADIQREVGGDLG